MGLSTQDHTFGCVAYWHSCYHAEMIWFQGWWTYLRTLTYTHTESPRRHTSHVCLFLLNVIKRCSDTAWCWLWWNKGALALCCCLTYCGLFRGCLTGCYKVYASTLSAAAVIANTGVLGSCMPHPRCVNLSRWIGELDFLNHVFLLFRHLHFSNFFFYDV